MIDTSPNMLLYIEPQAQRSAEPEIDDLTKRMTAAFQNHKTGSEIGGQFEEGAATMGHQTCACGAQSTPVDYVLNSGFITNSLCIHYLAWHRNEVPKSELDKVGSLPNEQATPSPEQLQ
jgi:hypothetical protein